MDIIGFAFLINNVYANYAFIFFNLISIWYIIETPSSSLMDSTTSPKVKIIEGEGIGAYFLARSILGVEGRAKAPGWDYNKRRVI